MSETRGRIQLLDLWRSTAVVLMLIYHFLYDLYALGALTRETFFSPGLNLMQRYICYSFILLAGISSRFSRNNIKRGFVLLGLGLVVSVGSALVGISIKFGVLSFLGCAVLIYALAGEHLQKLPGALSPVLFGGLFAVTRIVTMRVYVQARWLWPLGLRYHGFYSADYFPLVPWLFLFLLGAWLGGVIGAAEDRRLKELRLPGALTWPGRHSLVIYMLHQPLLYGLSWLLFGRG